MTIDQVSDLLREAIRIALVVSAPMLLAAMGAGLVISIFQAATQVNEQTLTFVPKIILTLAVFAICFPHAMAMLVEFSQRLMAGVAGGSP